MTMKVNNGESSSYFAINMTPLIDVMLVLLIIFIITIPKQTHAVKVDNPSNSPPANNIRPEVVDLSIDFDGTLSWDKTPIDRTTFLSFVSQEASKPVQPEVHITVDRFSRYEFVAQTLADLQHRGLKKIGFINNGVP